VRILFDQGTSVPLRQSLTHHDVTTVYERDWPRLKNAMTSMAKQARQVTVVPPLAQQPAPHAFNDAAIAQNATGLP